MSSGCRIVVAAFFWVASRICLSSTASPLPARGSDFSRPTNSGTIMCGNTTMSRSGRTGGIDVERLGHCRRPLRRKSRLPHAFQARQVEHGVEQDAFHDRAQATCAGLALDGLLGDRRSALLVKVSFTSSISNSRWYCLTSAFFGSVRIWISASSSRSSSVARPADGRRIPGSGRTSPDLPARPRAGLRRSGDRPGRARRRRSRSRSLPRVRR
jgi:hypothetical protein